EDGAAVARAASAGRHANVEVQGDGQIGRLVEQKTVFDRDIAEGGGRGPARALQVVHERDDDAEHVAACDRRLDKSGSDLLVWRAVGAARALVNADNLAVEERVRHADPPLAQRTPR